jgi:alkylation response protein AidB-like acyl-CoA dehydrogenase
VDFAISQEHRHLQERCRVLAAEFARRSAVHDREASHPTENYDRLRREGFLDLSIAKELGGQGFGFLGHVLAYEALAHGCPSTALSFNMHASVVNPLLESPEVTAGAKRHLIDLVVNQKKLIAGNYSEPSSTALIGERPIGTRLRRADGGYRVTGRKMFASMLQAADYCLIMARLDTATSPAAGSILLIPREAEGRSVDANWDVLGMRATRSDSLVLENCWVPEEAVVYQSDDIRPLRQSSFAWGWGSYTAVYLGVAGAAYDEMRKAVSARTPEGYAQSLAHHPDVRRHIALMSVELEAARLIMYRAAWLTDTQGSTPETDAALYMAKYVVGEAVSRITRTALTLGGAHGIFKGSRLEQLFRDGALGAIQAPQSDFCLFNVGLHELGLDAADIAPPLKPIATGPRTF